MDTKQRIRNLIDVLDQLAEDTSVPRNIRKGASEAKGLLLNEQEALDVRAASATYLLDDLANDPNLPLHGRTLIWNIMSQLETLKSNAEERANNAMQNEKFKTGNYLSPPTSIYYDSIRGAGGSYGPHGIPFLTGRLRGWKPNKWL